MNRPALYQQCTMRDAITTAITLDIFHRNCDVIDMACVAQTINVLNSLILTEGEHTILTPNYYVFEMYKPHREATLLEISFSTNQIGTEENKKVAQVYALASEKNGIITMNLVNTDMNEETEVQVEFEKSVHCLNGRILKGEQPNDYNSVDRKDAVVTKDAEKPMIEENIATFKLPAASVQVFQFSFDN